MRLAWVGPARKSMTRIVLARRWTNRHSETASLETKTSSTALCAIGGPLRPFETVGDFCCELHAFATICRTHPLRVVRKPTTHERRRTQGLRVASVCDSYIVPLKALAAPLPFALGKKNGQPCNFESPYHAEKSWVNDFAAHWRVLSGALEPKTTAFQARDAIAKAMRRGVSRGRERRRRRRRRG